MLLIRQALQKSGLSTRIHVADDGEKTIHYFEQIDANASVPCPDLILLDINLPRFKGPDILRMLRASTRCAHALVLVVTSSDTLRDREQMDALGANGYFRKPSSFLEFMKLGQVVRAILTRTTE